MILHHVYDIYNLECDMLRIIGEIDTELSRTKPVSLEIRPQAKKSTVRKPQSFRPPVRLNCGKYKR